VKYNRDQYEAQGAFPSRKITVLTQLESVGECSYLLRMVATCNASDRESVQSWRYLRSKSEILERKVEGVRVDGESGDVGCEEFPNWWSQSSTRGRAFSDVAICQHLLES
jgi:hypothetical protein